MKRAITIPTVLYRRLIWVSQQARDTLDNLQDVGLDRNETTGKEFEDCRKLRKALEALDKVRNAKAV